jgi:hypothetical protein
MRLSRVMPQITRILGDEHDAALRAVLRAVLIENGAIVIDVSWGVGGSQEVEKTTVQIGENLLFIESETFVGLAITGEKRVIEKIADQISGIRR